MSRYNMPEIKIPASMGCLDRSIAEQVLNKGKLRASKPKDGEAAYVWRMVAFTVSRNPVHQCMPITADWDLRNQYFPSPKFPPSTPWDDPEYRAAMDANSAAVRARIKELDAIADALIATIPVTQWAGALRWARAFGGRTTSMEGL